jgi:hypothetical protein
MGITRIKDYVGFEGSGEFPILVPTLNTIDSHMYHLEVSSGSVYFNGIVFLLYLHS